MDCIIDKPNNNIINDGKIINEIININTFSLDNFDNIINAKENTYVLNRITNVDIIHIFYKNFINLYSTPTTILKSIY